MKMPKIPTSVFFPQGLTRMLVVGLPKDELLLEEVPLPTGEVTVGVHVKMDLFGGAEPVESPLDLTGAEASQSHYPLTKPQK
jgi:hypothetical protein